MTERVHGGAIMPSTVANIGYTDRRDLNEAGKATIAQAVARDIPNGCSLFLNIGTTTEAVARALLGHRDIIVLTNNLNVANILESALRDVYQTAPPGSQIIPLPEMSEDMDHFGTFTGPENEQAQARMRSSQSPGARHLPRYSDTPTQPSARGWQTEHLKSSLRVPIANKRW